MENPSTPQRLRRAPPPAQSPQGGAEDSMAISDSSDSPPTGVSQPLAAICLADNQADTNKRNTNELFDSTSSSSSGESDKDSTTVMATPTHRRETETINNNFANEFSSRHTGVTAAFANTLTRPEETMSDIENELEAYEGDDGLPPNSPGYRYSTHELEQNLHGWDKHQQENRLVIVKSAQPSNEMFDDYPVKCDQDGEMNKVLKCIKYTSEQIHLLPPYEGLVGMHEAIQAARIERDKIDAFSGYDETEGPPWSCQHNGNTIDIDVVDYEDYMGFVDNINEAKEYLNQKYEHFLNVLDVEEGRMRMAASGTKVFYSYPIRKLWNVKADMEIRESDSWRSDLLLKIRPDTRGMKSLLYKGHVEGSLGRFLEHTFHEKRYVSEEVGLLRHVQCIDNLEELFLEMTTESLPWSRELDEAYPIGQDFIGELAPRISNLKVLSFGPGLIVLPEALAVISQTLMQLERLDISYGIDNHDCFCFPRRLSDIDKADHFRCYDFVLLYCVKRLKNLVRLDIGDKVCTDASDEVFEDDALVLNHIMFMNIEQILKSRGGILTRSAETLPPPYPNNCDKLQCRMTALETIAYRSKKDGDLRNLAHLRLQQLKAEIATQRQNDGNVYPGVDVEDLGENKDGSSHPAVAVAVEDLGESPREESTVVSNASNKRRHNDLCTPPDTAKVPRLP